MRFKVLNSFTTTKSYRSRSQNDLEVDLQLNSVGKHYGCSLTICFSLLICDVKVHHGIISSVSGVEAVC